MNQQQLAELIAQNPDVDVDLLDEALRQQKELAGVVRTEMLTFSFNLPYSSISGITSRYARNIDTDQ